MSPKNTDTPVAPKSKIIPLLTDPNIQDLFVQQAPNALAPNYIYSPLSEENSNEYEVVIQQKVHQTGIKNNKNELLNTRIWGYGEQSNDRTNIKVTWPGKTFIVKSNQATKVRWINDLRDAKDSPLPHILPIDPSNHWAYSLKDKTRSLEQDGIPLVPHLHGGHSDSNSDGNPEYFEGLTENSRGPRFVDNNYVYSNSQPAGTLWYHDHTLGLTRLNVYSGLTGFYIIRDAHDTGEYNNPLKLPAKQFEHAYCIQDRSFKANGDLFYPTGTETNQPKNSILPEIFGDHILVNGKIWPKTNVEPRLYRLRLLNGCDTRFMRLRFRSVALNETDFSNASEPLTFTVIGSDQGFINQSVNTTFIDFMPAERLDILFDFASVPKDTRIIIENIVGDEPFTGEEDTTTVRRTDRIIAFDITKALNSSFDSPNILEDARDYLAQNKFDKAQFDGFVTQIYPHEHETPVKTRHLALFGARDEYNRAMPLMGTAESVTDEDGNQVEGTLIWSAPITESPTEGDTEVWNIYNSTGHSHPIHVHLVHFDILSRNKFTATRIPKEMISDRGKPIKGGILTDIKILGNGNPVYETEKGPKDMVICYPGEVTQIRMKFDKPGRYVWHCHILSHEDHEMMRPIYVKPK